MARTIEIPKTVDLDKVVKEVMGRIKQQEIAMKDVEDLAKGKEVVVGRDLRKDLMRDLNNVIVADLPLRDILLFSGQARPATKREISELSRR